MTEPKYEEVEDTSLVKWDKEGTVVEGVLVGYESRQTQQGEGHIYGVESKEAVREFFAPSLLHKKLQTVPVGSVVRIEFVNSTKTGSGNTLKHFKVQHAEPNEANLKAIGMEHKIKEAGSEEVPF